MTSAYETGKIPEILVRHRLRIARETAGLEQAELANLVGISRTSVSNAESGKSAPRKITLNAWALATGVPVSWLLTGENRAPTGPGGGEQSPPSGLNRRPSLYMGQGSEAASVTSIADRRKHRITEAEPIEVTPAA